MRGAYWEAGERLEFLAVKSHNLTGMFRTVTAEALTAKAFINQVDVSRLANSVRDFGGSDPPRSAARPPTRPWGEGYGY